MAALSTTMALVMIAQGIAGLQWSPTSLHNNAVVYACANGTLSLPWSLTVAPGDTITIISWFVSGKSQKSIAAAAHYNFFAMPAFVNRARQLSNAGIELDHVGVSETGNYSVAISAESAAGNYIHLQRSVGVIVADGLQTTDGQLHISQQQEAEYDVATDQFHVVLRCGTFIHPINPAFEVTWETPSGQRNSSGYANGTFYLRLDGPMQGGTYTCRLPPVSSCANGHGSSVNVSVDKTEARLLLMEARQAALDSKNNALQAALHGLGEENQLLKVQSHRITFCYSLGEENQLWKVRTTVLESRVRVLGEENQLLKNRTAVLENQQNAAEGLLSQTVSFHARLSWYIPVDVEESSALVLPFVLRNHGDGYDNTTGVFTAPYSGTYFFLATAANYDTPADSRVDLYLFVNGVDVAHMSKKPGSSDQSASLHAVVALKAGETAYLYNYYDHVNYYGYATSFSGFLVDHTSNEVVDHTSN